MVRQRGQVTIPRKVRESLAIADGDTLTLVPLGEMLVLAPRRLRVPELAYQLADLLDGAGLSPADMLEELPRIREALHRERYGGDHDRENAQSLDTIPR
ncbi:AbrB/MazE/SpoVT family DNA-binding domain-containing protein [Promineifilum sp.]|uniref:AbrB/MazE/SpoVT family DNA-binding domain-containing protein n=1 Tax=Promineifilum sp. TaxID=2664178 RepID=UPI0035AEE732